MIIHPIQFKAKLAEIVSQYERYHLQYSIAFAFGCQCDLVIPEKCVRCKRMEEGERMCLELIAKME